MKYSINFSCGWYQFVGSSELSTSIITAVERSRLRNLCVQYILSYDTHTNKFVKFLPPYVYNKIKLEKFRVDEIHLSYVSFRQRDLTQTFKLMSAQYKTSKQIPFSQELHWLCILKKPYLLNNSEIYNMVKIKAWSF